MKSDTNGVPAWRVFQCIQSLPKGAHTLPLLLRAEPHSRTKRRYSKITRQASYPLLRRLSLRTLETCSWVEANAFYYAL